MDVIIPMCGLGNRFVEYSQPKPLVNVLGKEILFWVLDNLNVLDEDRVFIVFNKRLNDFRIKDRINKRYKFNILYIELDTDTRGAAETLHLGISHIKDLSENVMIVDSDTFYIDDILTIYRKIGGNLIFNFIDDNDNPIFSYVKVVDGKIIEIKEKIKISNIANCGCYCFDSKTLIKYLNLIISSPYKTKELYVSNIYFKMLEDGVEINSNIINNFKCLGTPTQIKIFSDNIANAEHKKFCFDLDNTLVTYPKIAGDYTTVEPIKENIKILNYLKSIGNTIIIHTARRMLTHSGNVGAIIKDVGEITLNTLEKFGIQYDELYFGKPHADFYIDDLAVNAYCDLDKELGFYQTTIKCRDFNSVNIVGDIVEKQSNVDMSGEIFFYENITKNISKYFPKLISVTENSMKIEKINGITFSYLYANKELEVTDLQKLLDIIQKIHESDIQEVNNVDIYLNYSEKLTERYFSHDYIKYDNNANKHYFLINKVLNEYEVKDIGIVGVIHGDPVFTNIIIDDNTNIKLIDMRGCVGSTLTKFGDVFYDYSKIYQSLIGYDFILNDKEFDSKYAEKFIDVFETFIIKTYGHDYLRYIKYITASLLLSLIPLHDNVNCTEFYSLSKKVII